MESLIYDLRYAGRALRKSPGFTAVAIITLALGIGANSAIFSLIDATLLRSLPWIQHPEQLAWISTVEQQGRLMPLSYRDYLDYRDQSHAFAGIVGAASTRVSLGSGGQPERIEGELVTGNYFSVLGVPARHGRTFVPEEDRMPGTHPVVVVSDALWRRRFGADPALVGQSIVLNGHAFTVIGIAPAGFIGTQFGRDPDVWVPAMMHAWLLPGESNLLTGRSAFAFETMGRLGPDVRHARARAEVRAIAARIAAADPRGHEGLSATVSELTGGVRPSNTGDVLPMIVLALSVTGIVLLIACSNVANLLLGRAMVRRREIGIRLALGATRARLVRQLLTESVVLSVAAGALGLMVALWATDLLLAYLQLPIALDLSPDRRVLVATLALALATGLLFGLAPALNVSRPDLAPALKDDFVAGGVRRSRLQSGLVVAQLSLSLVLLVSAGLLTRSMQRASTIDVGIPAKDNIVAASMDLGSLGYSEPRSAVFYRDLLDRVKALPDVQAAALATVVPLSGVMWANGVEIEGQPMTSGDRAPMMFFNRVSPDYFSTLGIPLVRGHEFSAQDRVGAPPVAIINEAAAQRFWPGEDAIGKRLRMLEGRSDAPYTEIIGVAKNAKYDELTDAPRSFLYLPVTQHIGSAERTLMVRTAHDPTRIVPHVRAVVRALDANLPLYGVMTMAQNIEQRIDKQRAGARLVSLFGLLAVCLATVGVYGVMAYAVSQRTREIGIRVALGAGHRDVISLVLRDGARLALVGVAVGVVLSLGVTRLIRSMLIGVGPMDFVTFVAVSLMLVAVAILASYIPARRAARVHPMVALRAE